MRAELRQELINYGIVLPLDGNIITDAMRANPQIALDEAIRANPRLAYDAQPLSITNLNSGIPAALVNLVDPRTIRILTTPMKASQIATEVKKGDWTTITTQFPIVESAGEVTSYGDFNNEGTTSVNYNWEPRQSYHFQTITQYGDREVDLFSAAAIDYVAGLNYAAALLMNKFLNSSYLFGVNGLQNYGFLNDPGLPAPITPSVKTAGGTTWAAGTASEVYQDFILLFTQIQTQIPAYAERNTPMTLALSNTLEPQLGKVTAYTLASIRKAITEEFPNLKIISVPEYNTPAGQVVQLWVDEIDGEETGYCAFTEKMRAGRVIPELSSYKQKKIGGTWGAIIRRPLAVAQMLGA